MATRRAISSSPSRRGLRGRRRRNLQPIAGRVIFRREGERGFDQREGVLERRSSARYRALELRAARFEALELDALLLLVEEGIAQRVGGAKLAVERAELNRRQAVSARLAPC